MERLSNKVVLITGAVGDLGKALVKTFLAEGAKVLAIDINNSQLAKLSNTHNSTSLITKEADVTSSHDMQAVSKMAEEEFGGLDIAVLNAGIVGRLTSIETYPEDIFDQVMAVNVKGVWLGIKYVSPLLRARGGGSIIVMSSIAGLIGDPNVSAYTASKHAVIGISRGAARELAADKIRVNCINPGQLDIGMVREFNKQQREEITKDIPLGRLGAAEDIAGITLFLASDESRYITGTINVVDGGYCGL